MRAVTKEGTTSVVALKEVTAGTVIPTRLSRMFWPLTPAAEAGDYFPAVNRNSDGGIKQQDIAISGKEALYAGVTYSGSFRPVISLPSVKGVLCTISGCSGGSFQ